LVERNERRSSSSSFFTKQQLDGFTSPRGRTDTQQPEELYGRERGKKKKKKKGLTQSLEKGFSTLFFFFIFDGKDERFFGGRNIDADCVLQVLQGG
jgi:hypothetical protein